MWMKYTLVTKFFVLLALWASFGLSVAPLQADVKTLFLKQSITAKLADQRLVGNVRAQAKREGVIVDVPEVFVYYSDFSPAYHLSGYRATIGRELELVINARRMERSMVRLDRLLERAEDLEGSSVLPTALPESDLYVVLYTSTECSVCDQVKASMEGWLADRSESVTWVLVSVD